MVAPSIPPLGNTVLILNACMGVSLLVYWTGMLFRQPLPESILSRGSNGIGIHLFPWVALSMMLASLPIHPWIWSRIARLCPRVARFGDSVLALSVVFEFFSFFLLAGLCLEVSHHRFYPDWVETQILLASFPIMALAAALLVYPMNLIACEPRRVIRPGGGIVSD